MRLVSVLEAAGITRDELRALVFQRREEQRQAEQLRVDAELLRIGREFADERAERTAEAAAADAIIAELFPAPPLKPEKPPLIETDGCAAYRCPNAPEIEVEAEFAGRVLRVLYCKPHGAERRAELSAAASGSTAQAL